MKKQCYNCNKEIEEVDIFCPDCGYVQNINQSDYFTLLSLPKKFDIGAKNLDVAYFAMQRKLHPDLFVRKSDKEKQYSMAQSLRINDAYEKLKSPLKRAEYLLELAEIIVNKDGRGLKPPPEILMETMQAREELSETDDKEEIRKILVDATDRKISVIDKINKHSTEDDLDKMAYQTMRLRYLDKLIEEIRSKGAIA